MLTAWDVYWILSLDAISLFFLLFAIGFLIAIFVYGCVRPIWIKEYLLDLRRSIDKKEIEDIGKKTFRGYKRTMIILSVILCFFMAGSVFIPNTKTAAAIYLLPKIVNNNQIQKLPDNVLKVLNSKLEELLNGKNKR